MCKGMGRRNAKMMPRASQKDLRGHKQAILRGTTTKTTTKRKLVHDGESDHDEFRKKDNGKL